MSASRYQFTTSRPVAIIMIVLGIAVFGFISYQQLSWDLMPEISYPTFTVRTEYPGAAPEEVENVVSRPLEEQLSLIKNLRNITSISRPEQSDIVLEFNWGTNLDRAAQEIREKLDQVNLERTVERPMVLRYDPSLDPILRLAVTSPSLPLIQLRQMVEDELARELEGEPGVAAARVKGGLEKEIRVKLDEHQLAVTRVPFNDIVSRLGMENVNLAGGNIKEGDTEFIVRTLNEFVRVEEIGEIIIAEREGVPIRLKDLAQVEYGHKERQEITRIQGVEGVQVDVFKEADANIVEVAKRVLKRILGTPEQRAYVAAQKSGKGPGSGDGRTDFRARIRAREMADFLANRLPEDVKIHVLTDQSVFIENSINEVKSTAVIGGILAVIVLYLFLQHFGTTLIVAVSIPISIVATFAPLKMLGVSMNIMSLGGLALGIGMLVDSSIVVMESIFRCREEGDEWVASAVRGVSEVGGAVIASTLTTIAVFFPIVFVEGVAGQIFGDLSLAVVFSLLASLMVSLFFIPMLASRRFGERGEKAAGRDFHFRFETERNLRGFVRLPLEGLGFLTGLVLHLGLYALMSMLALIALTLYPVLALVRLAEPLDRLLSALEPLAEGKRPLWEGFGRLDAWTVFRQGMKGSRGGWRKVVYWPYGVFRGWIQSLVNVFRRFLMTILGVFMLLGKWLGVFILVPLQPLLRLVVSLFNRVLDRVNRVYPVLLSWALRRDGLVLGLVGVAFVLTLLVVPRLGSELIPEVHQGTLYVNMTFPVGTPVDQTDRRLGEVAGRIQELPLVEGVGYFAGTSKEDLSEKEVGEHIGKITINVRKERMGIREAEEQVIGQIRDMLADQTDMDYNISRPVLFSTRPPIELVVRGFNLPLMRQASTQVLGVLQGIEGLRDVQSTIRPGFPELVVAFDRARLAHYGLNASTVANLIKSKVEGTVATQFKEQDKRVDVRVFLKDEQRQRAQDIQQIIVNPGAVVPILLSSVAEVKVLSGPNEIRRVDQERSGVITANVSGISLDEAAARIHQGLSEVVMPPGITWELSGQNEEMKTSQNSLILALALSVFLVYIVMASQFESFLHPFLILFTIPLAVIGVVWVLWGLNIPVGVTVYIGGITLVGIVVNNAIVLIDYINLLRRKGVEKVEAILQAGQIRLRPILITTLTTVLGLLPMALGLGEGAEIRTPMAITIIAGLSTSTFLTLVLIPVVYRRFSR